LGRLPFSIAVLACAALALPAASSAATSCPDADLQLASSSFSRGRAATLCLINLVRAQHGVVALTVNSTLAQIAQPYALKLVDENFFAHTTPGGQTSVTRFLLSGYLPGLLTLFHVGENLGWGTGSLSTPTAAVNAWIHSPEHLANILDAHFRETGIGIADGLPASLANGQPSATYVEEFGSVGP